MGLDRTVIRSAGGGEEGGRLPRDKRVVLVVIDGPSLGLEREVDHVPFSLGRQGADLTLADPSVSRLHALLVLDGGRFVLRDQNSTNGTFVEGHRVEQAALSHGVRFRLGDTTLQFVLEKR
ncbi:MAG TPA: FHA domain-containing protein [Thermodesulfobacteriota bacterium]